MAQITVKDLPQSDELDRQAMLSIAGGARTGVRPVASIDVVTPRSGRIVDYPPGFGRHEAGQAPGRQAPR